MQVPTVDPTLITAEPDGRPANTLELWTPRGIGWASVLLGFPGATVLAALNWRRMGRTRKAIVHLVAAVIGTWAIYFVNASVGLLVGLAVGYYLFRAQRSDQSPFATTERSGLAGALIAIAASILIVASGVVIETAAPTGAPRARARTRSRAWISRIKDSGRRRSRRTQVRSSSTRHWPWPSSIAALPTTSWATTTSLSSTSRRRSSSTRRTHSRPGSVVSREPRRATSPARPRTSIGPFR